jgi:DNA-binding NtrC family response regulator
MSMAHILLVEPDRRIRDFVAGILADCGHAVAACAGDDAAAATLAVGTVDLVVTDLVLRRGNSSALGWRCAALGVPMVTLSGCAFHPGRRRATEQPLPLVEKPFRFADLRSVLDAARYGHGSVRHAAVTRDAA